jgi:hypothetical protein
MAEPLQTLRKKDVAWHWTDVEQTAFDALKAAMTSNAVLVHPELGKEGWLLGVEKVIQFASKVLNSSDIAPGNANCWRQHGR